MSSSIRNEPHADAPGLSCRRKPLWAWFLAGMALSGWVSGASGVQGRSTAGPWAPSAKALALTQAAWPRVAEPAASGASQPGVAAQAASGPQEIPGPEPLQSDESRKPSDPSLDLSLEELLKQPSRSHRVEVSTASRYAEQSDKAPSVTYVLTRVDLKRHGARTLADALNLMPQIYPGRHGAYTVVGARGIGRPSDFNARVLLVVDGVRMNENIYDSALVDQSFILDIDLVDRIEYAPGPGSALYGNNAFIGVIQVFTRRGGQLGGWRTSLQVDRMGEQRVGVQGGWRTEDGAEWLVSVGRGLSRRIPLDPRIMDDFNPLLSLDTVLSRRWDWSTRYMVSGHWSGWSWMWAQSVAERGFPTLRWNDAHDEILYLQDRESDTSRVLSLAYDGSIAPDWDLHWSFQRSRYVYAYESPAIENSPNYFSRANGRWQYVDLRLENHSLAGHHWVFGVEQQYDRLRDMLAGNDANIFFGPLQERAHRYGVYLQDSWEFNPKHVLVAGWRRDVLPGVYAANSPRIAWNYRPGERDIVRWQYGTAFRAPNLYERVGNELYGVPSPAPERMRSHQWSWEREWQPGWRTQLTHFRSRVIGLVEPDASGFITVNDDNIRSFGWEWLVDDRRSPVWRWQLSGTWQKSLMESGTPLTNSPRLLLKFRGTYRPSGSASEWSVDAMQIGARQGYGASVNSAFTVNASWRWQPDPSQSLTVSVDNLFDRRIVDPSDGSSGVLTNYGRNLRVNWTRSWP